MPKVGKKKFPYTKKGKQAAKKAAKKKLLKELTKVNSDIIDVIKSRDYFYSKYMRLDLQLLIDDLQLVHEFYEASDVFKNDVVSVIAHLQENLVPEEEINE